MVEVLAFFFGLATELERLVSILQGVGGGFGSAGGVGGDGAKSVEGVDVLLDDLGREFAAGIWGGHGDSL